MSQCRTISLAMPDDLLRAIGRAAVLAECSATDLVQQILARALASADCGALARLRAV